MTEENDLSRRRSRSHQALRATQLKQRQQEEEDEDVGVEGEQELGGDMDGDKLVRRPPARSRSANSSLRQRRQNRMRNSNPDVDALPDDQSVKSSNTTKLNRTSRLRSRRSANATTEDRDRSRSTSGRGLDGKERRSSFGVIDTIGVESTQRSQRSFSSRGDSTASDEKFLQERKSRQDEILGQVLSDFRKAAEEDPSESAEVDEEAEKPRSRLSRRPSLTRLADVRKRVQERMTKGSSGEAARGTSVPSDDEEGEMELKDDYDPTQMEDRQKSSLVQRVNYVVKTPEKAKRKMLGNMNLSPVGSPLVSGEKVNKSNWDI